MNVAELINLIGFKLDKASYNSVNDATQKLIDKMDNIGTKARNMFTLPFVAFSGLAVKLYAQNREAIAQVEQGLISTNYASKKGLEELIKQADTFQRNTILDDDQILRNVTAQVLTFTNITENAFDRAQQAILDVSAKLDPTMNNVQSIAIQLSKALNDPIANLSALSRSGIQFAESQKKIIEQLWKGGKQAEAQSIILTEIERQYGGSAKVLAENSTGAKGFQHALEGLLKLFGKDLFPMWKKFISYITEALYKLQDFLTPAVRRTILVLGGLLAIIGPLILGLTALSKIGLATSIVFSKLSAGFTASGGSVLSMIGKFNLWLLAILAIAGALFLIVSDIIVYMKGGNSLIGQFIEPWKTLGPKLYDALKPYMILMGDLWESLKKTGVAAINYTYDVMNQRSDDASKHLDEMIYNFGDSIGNIGAIILPALWAIWTVFWNTAFDFVATLLVDIVVGFDEMMKSIEKSVGKWIDKFYGWLSGMLDKFYLNIYNKLMNLVSSIGAPKWLMNIIAKNVDTAPRFGDWRNEPSIPVNSIPIPYNSLNSTTTNKTSKQLNVTVNADLQVPQGTPEIQQNFLKVAIGKLFDDHINTLSHNLVQALPEESR